jgi:hypothetical protein
MAAIVHWFKGSVFRVDPGTLAFSVTIFCIEGFICIIVIVARRHPAIGGELGGPRKFQVYFFVSMQLFLMIYTYCFIVVDPYLGLLYLIVGLLHWNLCSGILLYHRRILVDSHTLTKTVRLPENYLLIWIQILVQNSPSIDVLLTLFFRK